MMDGKVSESFKRRQLENQAYKATLELRDYFENACLDGTSSYLEGWKVLLYMLKAFCTDDYKSAHLYHHISSELSDTGLHIYVGSNIRAPCDIKTRKHQSSRFLTVTMSKHRIPVVFKPVSPEGFQKMINLLLSKNGHVVSGLGAFAMAALSYYRTMGGLLSYVHGDANTNLYNIHFWTPDRLTSFNVEVNYNVLMDDYEYIKSLTEEVVL